MENQDCTLNIRYDLPQEIWDKIPTVYSKMSGWLGFGENGIPYWFSYNEGTKHILASVEPGGILLTGRMDSKEWVEWKTEFKKIATQILGFKVGEIEEGEVGYEIEWLK